MRKIIFIIVSMMMMTMGVAWAKPKLELQFYTQTYRLNSPIYVMINVVNDDTKPFKFQVSPEIFESFFFVIKTPRNENIQVKDIFKVKMQHLESSAGQYRPIILENGESFSRSIDITQWFDIREAGYYYIKGLFMPNPDEPSKKIESSFYKILVKPPVVIEKKIREQEQQKVHRIEVLKKMPPYEAISDLIDAKRKKDWSRFLAHIDAERLVMSFQNFASEYKNARTGSFRLDVIKRFKRYLTVHWQDLILSYTVGKTIIEDNKAQVECDVKYKIRTLSYTLRYTFYLYKNHENQWLVYDYTALRIQ